MRGSQISLLVDIFVALNTVTGGKGRPAVKADTTFSVFAHFGHVLLDVLQRSHRAWSEYS